MKKILFAICLFFSINIFAQDTTIYSDIQSLIELHQKTYEHYKLYSIKLADAARSLENPSIIYDSSYIKIAYPNGDVSANKGVCSDVIIRAFRKAFDWDLQETIYLYRKENNLSTDKNIDHRRVRNLMDFFDIFFDNQQLCNPYKPSKDYKKGNIIIWDLGGGQLHIGICVDDNMIIHNICCGQVIEPMYMEDRVIRNYSFNPQGHKKAIKYLQERLKELECKKMFLL